MSRFQVSLLPAAEDEIGEAFDWYRARSRSAANGFRDAVVRAIDALEEDPLAWPADVEGVRYFVLARFPYTIHYEVTDQQVTVLAVAHQRRRPGYWQQR